MSRRRMATAPIEQVAGGPIAPDSKFFPGQEVAFSNVPPAPRKMPRQRPGASVQEVGTPRNFLDAVEARFGKIVFDLAANAENAVVPFYFGPGSPLGEDALAESCEWDETGIQFLNPPFGNIAPWAKKCASYYGTGARIVMLVPASVGTNWFAESVAELSRVFFLSPRLTFNGHTQSYPKDLILAVYGMRPGFECWRWK